MTLIFKGPFEYWRNFPAMPKQYSGVCDLELYQNGERLIALITEREDNPGMSITNAAEHVIENIIWQGNRGAELNHECSNFALFDVVERYRADGHINEEDTYDRVHFEMNNAGNVGKVTWKRIDAVKFYALAGELSKGIADNIQKIKEGDNK